MCIYVLVDRPYNGPKSTYNSLYIVNRKLSCAFVRYVQVWQCACVCLWGPFRCTWENGHVNYRTTFPVLLADRRTLLPSSFYITLALLTCSHNMHIVYPDNTRLQIHTHIRVCNAYISTNVLYMSVAIFPSINIDQSHRQTRTFITVHIICMTTHAVHSFLVGIRSRDDVALSHYWPRWGSFSWWKIGRTIKRHAVRPTAMTMLLPRIVSICFVVTCNIV